jgi:type VI secretion system secreted protein Hcp
LAYRHRRLFCDASDHQKKLPTLAAQRLSVALPKKANDMNIASDIFLKLDGINGESQDKAHPRAIQVIFWEWIVSQQSNMHAGSGGGAGKASFSNLEFKHEIDRASPNLFAYCASGKHIPKAELIMRKAGGNPLEYLRLTMSDVLITKVHPSADAHYGIETVGLSFAKIKQEYIVQNGQGGSAGAVTATFDIKANKAL